MSDSYSYPKVPLEEAARPDDGAPQRFVLERGQDIHVYSLDACKKHFKANDLWRIEKCLRCGKSVCEHKRERRAGFYPKDFRTVDAVCPAPDGVVYFIEFKAKPSTNANEGELWEKAFESIYAALSTIFANMTFTQLCAKAELVVVFKTLVDNHSDTQSQASAEAFGRIAKPIRRCADQVDETARTSIRFGLELFRRKGLYRAVHTFDEVQFNRWASGLR